MKLTITVGGLTRKVAPTELSPESAAELIDEIAAEPKGVLVLKVHKFADWPGEARALFFDLWAGVKPSRAVQVRAHKTTYAEPLDLVLDLLGDAPAAEEVEAWLTEAASVVAACYSQTERSACAGAVVKQLQTVGFGGITESEFLVRVAEEAGEADSGPAGRGPNPTLLAADFVERHRATPTLGPLAADAHTLHYFGGTFYAWDRAWTPIAPEEMRALVARDLQDHSGADRVTTALVANVLLNLEALCLVGRADQPLPFHIDEYGPPTRSTRRKMLAFQNGLLDLEAIAAGAEVQLLPHDPRWFGTSVLPFAFDPDATCEQVKKFLYQVLERNPTTGKALTKGDRRLQVLQEWLGYSLLPDGRFQKFLLMVGEGSNGKGVIQNLWVRMLGEQNVAHVSLDQLSERFALQPLLGKMANVCGDLCEIDAVAEGVLKRLTGQDNITVDVKNRPAVTMAPTVKLVFATNTLPRFADKSRGVWRRLAAMPFRVVIPDAEQDETFGDKLGAELPGILNWALAGLHRLLQNGRFTACVVCAAAAKKHQLDCDPVAQFVDEGGIHPPPPGGGTLWVPVDTLYQKYREWCDEGGYKPKSRGRFNSDIAKLEGVTQHRATTADATGKRPYHWVGIGSPIPLPGISDGEDHDEDTSTEEAA